jgi:hypothetical protein
MASLGNTLDLKIGKENTMADNQIVLLFFKDDMGDFSTVHVLGHMKQECLEKVITTTVTVQRIPDPAELVRKLAGFIKDPSIAGHNKPCEHCWKSVFNAIARGRIEEKKP